MAPMVVGPRAATYRTHALRRHWYVCVYLTPHQHYLCYNNIW